MSASSPCSRASDPVIVFDGVLDDYSDLKPISIGFRQPSFTQLQGDPIPKGFDSLADFCAEKLPTRVTPCTHSHDTHTCIPIQEMLRLRNERKWKEMGYDPDAIVHAVTRNGTQTPFNSSVNLDIADAGPISNSFTSLDAITHTECVITLRETIEDNSSRTMRALKRCPSQGYNPKPTKPHTSVEPTPLISDWFQEIPERLRKLVVHPPDSITVKALAGHRLGLLQETTYRELLNDLWWYREMAVEHDFIGEACFIAVTIERLMCDNAVFDSDSDTEVDIRVDGLRLEIVDALTSFAEKEEMIREQKCNDLQAVQRWLAYELSSLDRKLVMERPKFSQEEYQAETEKRRREACEAKERIQGLCDGQMAEVLQARDRMMKGLFQRLDAMRRKQREMMLVGLNVCERARPPKALSSRDAHPDLHIGSAIRPVKELAETCLTPRGREHNTFAEL